MAAGDAGVRMFRTVDEFLALTGADAPTPAEVRLVEAVRAGERCEISQTRPDVATRENTVRAGLLRLLITGATPQCGTQDYGVWLEGGWITGVLDLACSTARGRTVLGSCHFAETPVLQQAALRELSLDGSRLKGLSAQGMTVKGNLFLRKVTASRKVDVNGAKVGGQMSCIGACFGGERDLALNAQGAEIGENLFLNGVTATGTIVLAGAKVGGQMAFDGSSFDAVQGEAVFAQGLHVGGGLFWRGVTVKAGPVVLTAAQVGELLDDGQWPGGTDALDLDGFTYDRISGDRAQITAAGRRGWLRAGSVWHGRFRPQPYTQLARVFRAMGHGSEARTVLFWREREVFAQARADLLAAPVGADDMVFGHLGREVRAAALGFGGWLLRVVVGYGYKPFRAFWCLFVLWFAAFLLADQVWERGQFAPNSDVVLTSAGWQAALVRDCFPAATALPGCDPNPAKKWSDDAERGMDWESFSAWGYALDLVVPILDLGQTDAWAPSKDRGRWGRWLWWGRWVFEVLGWIVTALGAAAVTGIMQRERE